MPVIALEVLGSQVHANADTLRIYQLGAPGREPIQVVANDSVIHQTGDVVAVALIGTVLDDGTRIRPARLRGAESMGMALGAIDVAPGSDVTERFIASGQIARGVSVDSSSPAASRAGDEKPVNQVPVVKWTSVELLHHVRRGLEEDRQSTGEDHVYPVVTYRAKVKLDGSNGGVQILPSGDVVAQSRSRVITRDDDNIEFAAWVDDHRALFASLANGEDHLIVFGEWCGRGIQKRTAISKIERRVFAVFAVQYGDHKSMDARLEVEPERIRAILPEHPDVFVLPWHGEAVTMDFADRGSLEVAAERINQLVADVEGCDPWVREVFGVDGMGEGVVLYPVGDSAGPVARLGYTSLMFKAKGDKHQVVRQKRPAQIDPEVAASVAGFVALFVTPARLEQGVREACGGELDMRHTGDFLRWIGQDVKKESPVEMEASGLVWKDVSKAVNQAALRWYKARVEAI